MEARNYKKGRYCYLLKEYEGERYLYIGSTSNLYNRYSNHLTIKDLKDNGILYKAYVMDLSSLCLSLRELRMFEQYMIDKLSNKNNLLNEQQACADVDYNILSDIVMRVKNNNLKFKRMKWMER